VRFTSYKTVLAGGGRHVTRKDVSDLRWPEVTQGRRHLTGRSPGSGCRRLKTGVCCAFHNLQDCSLQQEAITWREMTTRDLKWPEVTRKWRHWPEVNRKVCEMPRTGVYCAFDFLQGCSTQEAVTWQEMMSRDLRSPEVSRKWRDLTGSHLEVAVEGRKLAYTVCLTSCKAVGSRRPSRYRNWRHVTSGDRKWPEVTSFDRKSPGSGCRRPKTGVYWAFDFLQGCGSQEEAVTWQEMTSRELRWPELTRKWLTASSCELQPCMKSNAQYASVFGLWMKLPVDPIKSRHFKVTSGHMTSWDVISGLVTASSCKLQPCVKSNAQYTPIFGFLQPLSGDFRSNDVTSASVSLTWGHMMSFPVT